MMQALYGLLPVFLVFSGREATDEWKKKVEPAIERAAKADTPAAWGEALDTIWHADDWQAGLRVAGRLGERKRDPKLIGRVVRAYWRGGELSKAEELEPAIPLDSTDRVALRMLIHMRLSRGDVKGIDGLADRLEKLKPESIEDWTAIIGARMEVHQYVDLPKAVRKARELVNPKNGYPDELEAESLEGLDQFFEAVGTEPMNQVSRFGETAMAPLATVGLPYCDAYINGKGPFRLMIDTGGSVMLSVDTAVAEECGLKYHGEASIRGVSGKDSSQQALVDELRIGGITCKRVATRVFAVKTTLIGIADGILGTGIFGDARMTLDFQNGKMIIAESADKPAAGASADARIISDAKLVVPVTMQDESRLAIFDSGADTVAISPSRLRALFPDREGLTMPVPMAGVGSGEAPEVSMHPGVNLTIAGKTYRNFSGLGLDVLDTLLSPALGVQCDVLCGMVVFRDMKSITVDFPRRKIWIDWQKE